MAKSSTCQNPRDLVQPCTKFSIRDYAFSSRSKGINRSWPFHPDLLHLFLKRGVRDPLPPFEPPDLIRSSLFNTFTNVGQYTKPVTCVGLVKTRDDGSSEMDISDINFQSSQRVDESSLGPSLCTSPKDGKFGIGQVESTNESDHTNGLIPVDLQDNSWAKTSQQTELAGPLGRSKNLESSCETSQKKCKLVVKLGTLTDSQRTEDIAPNSTSVSDQMASKTCPVCKVFASTSNTTLNAHIDQCLSIESNPKLVEMVRVKPKVKPKKKRLMVDIYKDLDRGNDTNAAIELTIPVVNNEVWTQNQIQEVVPFDARDDEKEGDVYVDSNGIKVQDLSKCTDAPLVLSDEVGTKKVPKHNTRTGMLLRKKILKSKMLKNKMLKMQGKKYNEMNRLNSQVQADPRGGIDEDTTEGGLHAQNPMESSSNHGSGTMRQWVCSKQLDISKNGAQELARNNMLGFDSSPVIESPTEAFSSEQPEEMGTTLKSNGVEHSKDSSRLLESLPQNPPHNSVLPKATRLAAAIAKRKIREIGRREAYKSDNYDATKDSRSLKRSGARSYFSIAGPSNGFNRLASTSKKFRKQRSMSRTGRHAFSPSGHSFGQGNGPDTRHATKKFRLNNNSTLKKFVKHTEDEEDTPSNDLSFQSGMPLSGQQDNPDDVEQQTVGTETYYGCEKPENDTPNALVSSNGPDHSCNEISNGSLSPENNGTGHDILVEDYSIGVEDPGSSEQLQNHANETMNVVSNEMNERQMDLASTKESSACVNDNREMGPRAPQNNSSMTSDKEYSNQEHGLLFGRNSLDSHVLTASTMPPNVLKDSRTKESVIGPSTLRITEQRITGSLNQETNSAPTARHDEQLSNEEALCCSCQKSISKESQIQNQSEITRPLLNFRGKQVSQLHIGLTASSSFDTYQTTSTKANPFLDSLDQPSEVKISGETSKNLSSYTTGCTSHSLQTQLSSPSNHILRLMGKNLMVNNEESVHPPVPSSEYNLKGNYVAPVGFVSPNYQHPNDFAFMNTAPAIPNHQIPLPSVQAGSFARPPLHNNSLVQSHHHSQRSYRNLVPVMHHPTYTTNEVIMIDDSPERRSESQVSMLQPPAPTQTTISVPNTTAPMPFFYLPPPPVSLRERVVAGSLPVFANIGSMVGFNSSGQGSQTEVANSYMSSPSFVHSQTGYINSPVYYSQNPWR